MCTCIAHGNSKPIHNKKQVRVVIDVQFASTGVAPTVAGGQSDVAVLTAAEV